MRDPPHLPHSAPGHQPRPRGLGSAVAAGLLALVIDGVVTAHVLKSSLSWALPTLAGFAATVTALILLADPRGRRLAVAGYAAWLGFSVTGLGAGVGVVILLAALVTPHPLALVLAISVNIAFAPAAAAALLLARRVDQLRRAAAATPPARASAAWPACVLGAALTGVLVFAAVSMDPERVRAQRAAAEAVWYAASIPAPNHIPRFSHVYWAPAQDGIGSIAAVRLKGESLRVRIAVAPANGDLRVGDRLTFLYHGDEPWQLHIVPGPGTGAYLATGDTIGFAFESPVEPTPPTLAPATPLGSAHGPVWSDSTWTRPGAWPAISPPESLAQATLLWRRPARARWRRPVRLAPASDDGVYLIHAEGLDAVRPDGRLRWSRRDLAGAGGIAMRSDETLFVGGSDGTLYQLAADGATIARCHVATSALGEPAVGAGVVYVVDLRGVLYAVHPPCSVRWSFATGFPVTRPLVDAAGRVVLATWSVSNQRRPPGVYALDAEGRLLWRVAIAAEAPVGPVLRPDGTLLAGGLLFHWDARVGFLQVTGRGLFVIDSAGTIRWAAVTGPPLALVARKDGSVCTVTAGGEPVRLACFTGSGSRQLQVEQRDQGPPVLAPSPTGTLLLARGGGLTAIGRDGTPLWGYTPASGRPQFPMAEVWAVAVTSKGLIYVAGPGGWLESLRPPLPGARRARCLAPDGVLSAVTC